MVEVTMAAATAFGPSLVRVSELWLKVTPANPELMQVPGNTKVCRVSAFERAGGAAMASKQETARKELAMLFDIFLTMLFPSPRI
jgi:hypothetical protein